MKNKKKSNTKKKSTISGNDISIARNGSRFTRLFNRFAARVTKATGRPAAFLIAFLVIIIWAVSGPIFHFSDTWQLVINTGTTIITFLMVFVIQHAQNKDTAALQIKLDELLSSSGSSNEIIDVEELDEEQIEDLKKFYAKLRTSDHEKKKNIPSESETKRTEK